MMNLKYPKAWTSFLAWLHSPSPIGPSTKPNPKFQQVDSKANSQRIPSISHASIIYSGFLGKLLKFGVFVKAKKVEFHGRDSKMNRYLRKQIKRLKLLVATGQYEKFWLLWFRMMMRSVALGYLALHKVIPDWYKTLPRKEVKQIMKKFNKIRRDMKTDYTVREKEFPKPNGKMRTLSIPTKPWRLYLYLVNLGLHLFINPELNENQYGHRAGMGVMKCWTTILRSVNKWKYF